MSVHLFDSSAAQVGAGEKTGYVYVLPGEVESILKQGYLSVREQLNRGLTNENALMVKYGDQFDEAQVQYDDCPSNIVSYLDWRGALATTTMGQKAIYYLTSPLKNGHEFAEN
jgi:cytochrome c1